MAQVAAAHTVAILYRWDNLSLGNPHILNCPLFALEGDIVCINEQQTNMPSAFVEDNISTSQNCLQYKHPWKHSLE